MSELIGLFINYVFLMLKKTIGCTILFYLMNKSLHYKCENKCSDTDFVITMYIFYNILTKSIMLFYYLCDKYKWFNKYKINKNASTPNEIINQGIISNIIKLIIDPFINILMLKITKINVNEKLPTYSNAIMMMFFVYFISDFVFYFIHRTMHHRLFYWIHKKHHTFNIINTLGAEYASIGELLLSSESFLFLVFFVIYSIHPLLWFSLLYFKLFVNIELHSGYHLPFSISGIASAHHCLHHLYPYKGRYSEHPFVDKLFNTNN